MNSNTSNLPAVKIFCYNGSEIRNIQDNDGKIWFVAKDIAVKLSYSENTIKNNISNLFGAVPEEWKGNKRIIDTTGREQDMLCVTENGAYFFLARSDKPGALEFQMWLARDVVPSIIHTGEYVAPALKAARENAKPAPIPRDIKVYLSKANFSAQERIINRAIDVKYLIDKNGVNDDTDKECQKVLALDIAFKARTGYSALNAAGISIEANTNGQADTYLNWCRINWISHYKVFFHDSRLVLPAPKSEEHVLSE